MFLLVAHFDAPAPRSALAVLARQPDCLRLAFSRSTDRAAEYVLVAEFDSPAAYRRALSPFDVRTELIPWLSTALPGSGVHEALYTAAGGSVLIDHEPTVTPSGTPPVAQPPDRPTAPRSSGGA